MSSTGYKLSQAQVNLLKHLKKYKEYKKVPPSYKGMVTLSIKRGRIINSKHNNGVKEALKKVSKILKERFNSPELNIQRPIKAKVKPFKETYMPDPLLTKKQNHKKYLKSGIWERKRDFLFKKRGLKCENCQKQEELHLHHKTYAKWGSEYQKHLEILCADCHNKLHDKYTITELENFYKKGINPHNQN